jgi:hypothetical protein
LRALDFSRPVPSASAETRQARPKRTADHTNEGLDATPLPRETKTTTGGGRRPRRVHVRTPKSTRCPAARCQPAARCSLPSGLVGHGRACPADRPARPERDGKRSRATLPAGSRPGKPPAGPRVGVGEEALVHVHTSLAGSRGGAPPAPAGPSRDRSLVPAWGSVGVMRHGAPLLHWHGDKCEPRTVHVRQVRGVQGSGSGYGSGRRK